MKFNKTTFKTISLFVAVSFFIQAIFPSLSFSQELLLPKPDQFIYLSGSYSYPLLKGMKFDPADPLKMEFIIDTADQKEVDREEASRLIKYFLAGLTIPEQDLWVNMSPYEKDRIIPERLAETDLGKDLLSQDYILKQLSSSLTYPESETGKDYWLRTYEAVLKVAQTTKLPVNTFNKIWITPDKAVVYENENVCLITEASLKALLEEDYLALANSQQPNQGQSPSFDCAQDKSGTAPDNTANSSKPITQEPNNANNLITQQINKAASEVMREQILPKINADVNSGKNFANLRQIYYSLILSTWFKKKFQESIYKHYIDQNKISGIDLEDKDVKEKIYSLYTQAFTKGLYNYIKTDTEPKTRKRIKRQYFSGGFSYNPSIVASPLNKDTAASAIQEISASSSIEVGLNGIFPGDLKRVASSAIVSAPEFDVSGIPDFEEIESKMYEFPPIEREGIIIEKDSRFFKAVNKNPKVRDIFKEYDLRENVKTFNPIVTEAIIHAHTILILKMKGNNLKIFVGSDHEDYNVESANMAAKIYKGAGLEVIYVKEPITSPTAYKGALLYGCDNIAYFSASHNPYGEKGLKLGMKKGTTYGPYGTRILMEQTQKGEKVVSEKEGKIIDGDLEKIFEYYLGTIEKMGIEIKNPEEFRILLNPIHGTAGKIVSYVLGKLGIKFSEYRSEVLSSREISFEGRQEDPNPEVSWVEKDIKGKLEEISGGYPGKEVLGLAYNRDGDKTKIYREEVRDVTADKLGVLATRQMAKNYRDLHPEDNDKELIVIVDGKSSHIVLDDPVLRELKVKVQPTNTGHSYLKWHLRELVKEGKIALVGFEQSGHCFYVDADKNVVEDPVVFNLAVLQYLSENNLILKEAFDTLSPYLVGPSIKNYLNESKFDSEKTRCETIGERKYAIFRDLAKRLEKMKGQKVINGEYTILDVKAWDSKKKDNIRIFFGGEEGNFIGSIVFRPSSNEHLGGQNYDVLIRDGDEESARKIMKKLHLFITFLAAQWYPEFTPIFWNEKFKAGLKSEGFLKFSAEEAIDFALKNGWRYSKIEGVLGTEETKIAIPLLGKLTHPETENIVGIPLVAFIFDVDGVVTETIDLHFQSWQKAFESIEIELTWEDFNKYLNGKVAREGVMAFLKGKVVLWTETRIEQLIGSYGKDFKNYIETIEIIEVYGSTLNLMRKLKDMGIPFAFASAGHLAKDILKKIGLGSHIIVSGIDFPKGSKKDIFEEAAKRLGVDPAKIVVFEDSLLGIMAAKGAGMRVIGIERIPGSLKESGAEIIVEDLREMKIETAGSPVRFSPEKIETRLKEKIAEIRKNSGLPILFPTRELPKVTSHNQLWSEVLRALYFEVPVYRRVEREGRSEERYTGKIAFSDVLEDNDIRELSVYDVSKPEFYSIREGRDVRDYLFEPDAEVSPEAYFMHRGIFASKGDIWKTFYRNKIRFDITVIPPGIWGIEYAKTVGHYHDPIEMPEIYQVVSGEVLWLMQKCNEKGKIIDFITVRAKAGDIAIMLPGYGHVSINLSETEPLVMANWLTWHQSSFYGSYKEKRGAAYYVILEDGKPVLVPNPEYQKAQETLPFPLQMVAKDKIPGFYLKRGEPIYKLVELEVPVFNRAVKFLNYPNEYTNSLVPENTLDRAGHQDLIEVRDSGVGSSPFTTASSATPGGIDLGEIGVSVSPASSPIPLSPDLFKNSIGISFTILGIKQMNEPMDIKSFLGIGIVSGKEEQAEKQTEELAYLKD